MNNEIKAIWFMLLSILFGQSNLTENSLALEISKTFAYALDSLTAIISTIFLIISLIFFIKILNQK